MSKMIGKGPGAAEALMSEVEALFEMTVEQRKDVESTIGRATALSQVDWTYERFYDESGLDSCKVSGQPLEAGDYTDGEQNPDGGWVDAPGLQIRWQRGPVEVDEEGSPWNGAFPVTVLEALRYRLEYYQRGKFKCNDNGAAIFHIESAIKILNSRQIERFCRGVRGGHEE